MAYNLLRCFFSKPATLDSNAERILSKHSCKPCPCCLSANAKIDDLSRRLVLLEDEESDLRRGLTFEKKWTPVDSTYTNCNSCPHRNPDVAGLLDLPDEILIEIFLLLPINDRKVLRLVSKRLLEFYNNEFGRRIIWTIRDYKNLDSYVSNLISNVTNVKIKFEATSCKDAKYKNRKVSEFWGKYGPNILSVQLMSDFYSHEIVEEICNYCLNLEELSIFLSKNAPLVTENVEILPSISNLKLRTLFLKCNHLNPLILSSFLHSSSLIESISIEMISGTDIKDITEQFTPTLTIQLKKIALKYASLATYDKIFDRNMELTELKLMEFSLRGYDLVNILSNCKLLTRICLHGETHCARYYDWIPFFSKLPNLTHVNLRLSGSYRDLVSSLASLEHLQCLHLLCSATIPDNEIIAALGTKQRPKMTHLKLTSLDMITNDCLKVILPYLPNLKILVLAKCYQLTLVVLQTVLDYNRKLECLSIYGVNKVKQMPIFIPRLNELQRLVHVDLRDINCNALVGLKLSQLKTIVVSNIGPLKDDIVLSIFRNCLLLDYVLCKAKPGFKFFDKIFYNAYSGITRMLRKELLYLKRHGGTCGVPHFQSKV